MGATTTTEEGEDKAHVPSENALFNFKNDAMRDESSKDGESNDLNEPPAGENELRVSRGERPDKILENRGHIIHDEYVDQISKIQAESSTLVHTKLRMMSMCQ